MLLNCGVGEDLRVLWTARRSNQSILKISPEFSLEGLMMKLKLQYFGHLMRRTGLLMTWWWTLITWCAAIFGVEKSWTRLSYWIDTETETCMDQTVKNAHPQHGQENTSLCFISIFWAVSLIIWLQLPLLFPSRFTIYFFLYLTLVLKFFDISICVYMSYFIFYKICYVAGVWVLQKVEKFPRSFCSHIVFVWFLPEYFYLSFKTQLSFDFSTISISEERAVCEPSVCLMGHCENL